MARKARSKDLGRPVDTDSEQTRANIVNAAKECFGTAGFRATSNRDIADRAGVTAATIYYYFKNKSDLFISVHHEVQATLLGIARRCVEEATLMVEGWIAMSKELFEAHKADPSIAKFNSVVRMEAMRTPEISKVLYDQEWRDLFHELADLGISTGELDASKDREFRAVLSAINFGLSQHAIESSWEMHQECINGFIDLFSGKLINAKKVARKARAG